MIEKRCWHEIEQPHRLLLHRIDEARAIHEFARAGAIASQNFVRCSGGTVESASRIISTSPVARIESGEDGVRFPLPRLPDSLDGVVWIGKQ